jgi:uncharacterized membrane protein
MKIAMKPEPRKPWHKGRVPIVAILLGVGLVVAYVLFFAPAALLAVQ